MARVMLYSDQPVLTRGLAALLQGAKSLELANSCSSLGRLRQLAGTEQPDILLVDLTPAVNVAVLSELRRAMETCKIVLWVREIPIVFAFQALQLGIRGILRKTVPADLLLKCLQSISEGGMWFEKALTDRFLGAKPIKLTRREGQLVTLVAQGLKNKEVASVLGVCEGAVKVYLSRLFDKVGVKGRFELARYGLGNPNTTQAGPVSHVQSRENQNIPPALPPPFMLDKGSMTPMLLPR